MLMTPDFQRRRLSTSPGRSRAPVARPGSLDDHSVLALEGGPAQQRSRVNFCSARQRAIEPGRWPGLRRAAATHRRRTTARAFRAWLAQATRATLAAGRKALAGAQALAAALPSLEREVEQRRAEVFELEALAAQLPLLESEVERRRSEVVELAALAEARGDSLAREAQRRKGDAREYERLLHRHDEELADSRKRADGLANVAAHREAEAQAHARIVETLATEARTAAAQQAQRALLALARRIGLCCNARRRAGLARAMAALRATAAVSRAQGRCADALFRRAASDFATQAVHRWRCWAARRATMRREMHVMRRSALTFGIVLGMTSHAARLRVQRGLEKWRDWSAASVLRAEHAAEAAADAAQAAADENARLAEATADEAARLAEAALDDAARSAKAATQRAEASWALARQRACARLGLVVASLGHQASARREQSLRRCVSTWRFAAAKLAARLERESLKRAAVLKISGLIRRVADIEAAVDQDAVEAERLEADRLENDRRVRAAHDDDFEDDEDNFEERRQLVRRRKAKTKARTAPARAPRGASDDRRKGRRTLPDEMPQVVRRLCIKAKVDKRAPVPAPDAARAPRRRPAPVRDAADVFVSSTSSPTWRDDDDDDDAARDDAARRFESAPLFDSARDAAPLFGSGDARHTSRLIDSSREGTLFVNTSREGTLFDAGGGASPLFESGVDLYRAARLFDSGRRNDAQLFGDAFDGGGDEQNDEQNVYTIRLGDVAPPRFVLKSPRSDASSPRNALELSPWEAHV